MKRRKTSQQTRGTTILEILVAVALLLIIFLFITGDLLQSSQAYSVSSTRTETTNAANYLLGVMRGDSDFWNPDWTLGPQNGTLHDPCGNLYPPYTDSITAPTWHPAPACTPSGSNPGIFPDLAGVTSFQFMWNAQQQAADPNAATTTVWVMINDGGRQNIYELQSTRTNLATPGPGVGSGPTPTPTPGGSASICPPPCTSPTPASPTPKPSPIPTKTPSPTPTPSPVPSGTFE